MTKNSHSEKQKHQKNWVQTGNENVDLPQLLDLDKVLSIMGYDYVEGTLCPDSWPEKQVF